MVRCELQLTLRRSLLKGINLKCRSAAITLSARKLVLRIPCFVRRQTEYRTSEEHNQPQIPMGSWRPIRP
jgi:hypothetical protein